MKLVILALALAGSASASDCLYLIEADYRDIAGEPWLSRSEVYYIATDFMLVSAVPEAMSGVRFAKPLDASFEAPGDYVIVHISGPEGVLSAAELGPVMLQRGGIALVRLSGGIPEPFLGRGLHLLQPLRPISLDHAQAFVPPMRGYDDYVADIVAAVSEAGFQGFIQHLQDYGTRYSSTDSYDTAAAWVRDTIEGYGIDAELQYFSMGSYDCENVVAEKPGLTYPDKIYIICGHLDCTSPSPYSNAPGADDNASGSAAVVEAARVMSAYNFKYTIRFLCFGGEEQGLYGSAYYADQASSAGDDILGVVNLDMILYGPPGQNVFWVPYSSQSTGLGLAVDAICDTYVPALNVLPEYNPGLTASDHASFWNEGYTAVLGIEHEVYGNPYYHQTSDILSNYMSYFPFGTNCARGAIATIAYLAEPLGPTGTGESQWDPVDEPLDVLSIGPNPASLMIEASLTAPGGMSVELAMFDMAGRLISSQEVQCAGGIQSFGIGIGDLPDGVFFLRASGGGMSDFLRFVVAH